MNILVTGVAGYIGSYLVNKLVATEHKIVGIDKKYCNKNYSSSNYNFIQVDLADSNQLEEIFHTIDCVIHLAGESNVRAEKEKVHANNIISSENLIQAILKSQVKKLIFLSSIKSGKNGFYAKSKDYIEQLIVEKIHKSEVNYTIIQSTSVYGKGMKNSLVKWLRLYKYTLIPRLPVSKSKIEMIGINDLCEIIIRCTELVESNGKIYRISDGNTYSINELDAICSNYFKKGLLSIRMPKSIMTVIAYIGENLKILGFKIIYDREMHNQLFNNKIEKTNSCVNEIGYIPKQNFYTELDEILKQD